ncbi:unnamed protein product [marine sediment metagenome]|uniref:Uncharacterized protein n=1 Tax=marine sediment metagenome TaxID=412755 RepID=X1RZU8_9ZZZZ
MSFPAYQWLDGVTGGTPLNLYYDDYSAQALPFTFPFYGGNYDTVYIGSNGYLSFVYEYPDEYDNVSLPCTYDPECQKLIAPLWDDWCPLWDENGYPNSDVFVKSFTNPNRYVITWNDIFNYAGDWDTYADRSTFQVVLYENGDIRFNYKTVGITNGVTVGINDGDGTHYKSCNFVNKPYDIDLYSGACSSYTEARDLALADSIYDDLYIGQDTWNSSWAIDRVVVIFDTSSLVGGTIKSARIRFNVDYKNDFQNDDAVVIQHGMPDYPHDPPELGDYNQAHYSGNGGSISGADIVIGWNEIELNEEGLSWINTSGCTKFMLRSKKDIDGISPGADLSEYIENSGVLMLSVGSESLSSILFVKAEPEECYVALRSEEIDVKDIDDIIAVLGGSRIGFGDLEHLSISGRVSNLLGVPIEGEQIDILEDKVDSDLSDVNGQYSFTKGIYGYKNYTIQPNISGKFSPAKYEYHPLSVSKTNQNFIGYGISGKVYSIVGDPIVGETIYLSGDKVESVQTDVSGFYAFIDLRSYGNYTVQPNVLDLFSPTKYEYHPLSVSRTNQNFTRGANLGTITNWRKCFFERTIAFNDYNITTPTAILKAEVKVGCDTGGSGFLWSYNMIRDRITTPRSAGGCPITPLEFEDEIIIEDGDKVALVLWPGISSTNELVPPTSDISVGTVIVDDYKITLTERDLPPPAPPADYWQQMHCTKSGGFYEYRLDPPGLFFRDKVKFCPFGILQSTRDARMLMTARRTCTSPCDGDLIVKKNGAEIYRHWLTYSSSAHNVYFTVQDGDVIEVRVECTGGSYVSGSIQNAKVEVYKEYKV